MTTIAVAGATGTVGEHVLAALTRAGHRPVPLARSAGVDVSTGRGLDEALHGVDAVIDVLNVTTQSAATSIAFFETTTATLLAAEAANGIGHHVLLSIVGIDGTPAGYYAGKLRQEALVRDATVPWTIVRATQFHEFAGQVMARATLGPVSLVPKALLRPVAAAEVGTLLAERAAGAPLRATVDLRGPRDEQLVDMARRLLDARGERRRVVPLRLPGALGAAMRSGALRGGDSAQSGSVTYADWLRTLG